MRNLLKNLKKKYAEYKERKFIERRQEIHNASKEYFLWMQKQVDLLGEEGFKDLEERGLFQAVTDNFGRRIGFYIEISMDYFDYVSYYHATGYIKSDIRCEKIIDIILEGIKLAEEELGKPLSNILK